MGSSISYGQHFYFDPNVDTEPTRADYCSTKWELREKLDNLADASEKIKAVSYYTHPLNVWQMSKIFLHHAFIVLETDSWFWSIEKDEGGITIQRSKYIANVRDNCRRCGRMTGITTGIGLLKKGPSDATVMEVVDYLWRQDCMNLNYHFLNNNCQHFADIIYNQFVRHPPKEWVMPFAKLPVIPNLT
jgi:hypothetical protein